MRSSAYKPGVADFFLEACVLYVLLGWQSRETAGVFLLLAMALFGILTLRWDDACPHAVQVRLRWRLLILPALWLVSVFASPYIWGSWQEWCRLVGYAAIFIVSQQHLRRAGKPIALWYALFGIAVLTSIYGLGQFIWEQTSDAWIIAQFGWHNTLAGFLLPMLLIGFTLVLTETSRKRLALLLPGLVCMGSVFVLTYSRAAWLSLAFGFLPLFVLLAVRLGWKKVVFVTVSMLAICLLCVKLLTRADGFAVLPDMQRNRVVSVEQPGANSSVEGRWQFWQGAWTMFLDHPLTGVGLDQFGTEYPRYQQDVRYFSYSAHQFYLELLAETGSVGLVTLAVLLVGISLLGYRTIRVYCSSGSALGQPHEPTIRLGVYFGLLSSCLHVCFDWDWDVPAVALVAVLLASSLAGFQPKHNASSSDKLQGSGLRSKVPRWIALGWVVTACLITGLAWIAEQSVAHTKSPTSRDALAQLDRAQRFLPYDASLQIAEGLVLFDQQQFAAAADAFERAVKLDTHSHYASYLLGLAYWSAGRLPEAAVAMETSLAGDSWNRPRYYYDLAVLYTLLSQPERSEALLVQVTQLYTPAVMQSDMPSRDVVRTDVRNSYRLLADIYAARGDRERVLAVQSALESILVP
ncbi:MAG TPA: O-antigen ligase family protein [bacterium]|nr:O-antigen ligase family protein [bacterium]